MSKLCFYSQTGHLISFMSSFSSWTLSVVFEVYDSIILFKWIFSSISTYTLNASWEKSESVANKVSLMMKSIKFVNYGSLTLRRWIVKTFLFQLSLTFPGSFDVGVQRKSDEYRELHCCRDMMLSHFIKKL